MRRPVETSGCRRPRTRTTVQGTPMWSPPAPIPATSAARPIPVTAGCYLKTTHCTPKPDTASDGEINSLSYYEKGFACFVVIKSIHVLLLHSTSLQNGFELVKYNNILSF